MSYWTGTLDLVRQVLEATPAWVTACAPALTANRTVVGVGGHPWDGTLLALGGKKPLALPIAQIGLGDPSCEPNGARRWSRRGSATIDFAMSAPATPQGYIAAVQLAEDVLESYRAAADAGTLLLSSISVSGPPLLLPPTAPSIFAGAWVFQITITWDINR